MLLEQVREWRELVSVPGIEVFDAADCRRVSSFGGEEILRPRIHGPRNV